MATSPKNGSASSFSDEEAVRVTENGEADCIYGLLPLTLDLFERTHSLTPVNVDAEISYAHWFVFSTEVVDILKSIFNQEGVPMVGLLLVLSFFLTVACLKLINQDALFTNDHIDGCNQRNLHSSETSWFYLFGTLLYQAAGNPVKKTRSRILSISHQLFSFLFVCLVFANMKTMLVINKTHVIWSIHDAAKDTRRSIFMLDRTAILKDYFSNHPDKDYQLVFDRVCKSGQYYQASDLLENIQVSAIRGIIEDGLKKNFLMVARDTTMSILLQAMKEVYMDRDEKFLIFTSREPMAIQEVALTGKNSTDQMKSFLKQRHQVLVESGLYAHFYGDMITAPPQSRQIVQSLDEVDIDEQYSLTLQSLRFTFIFWGIALGASSGMFVMEILFHVLVGRYLK